MRAALPELELPPAPTQETEIAWGSAWTLDGELAHTLSAGRAYGGYSGTPAAAKALAVRACDELVGGRYDEVLVYTAQALPSPWFYRIAWDRVWIGIDKRTLAVWVLCVTDTD